MVYDLHHRYAYYICYKCNKAYFGGEQACAAAANQEYDPKELICGSCAALCNMQLL